VDKGKDLELVHALSVVQNEVGGQQHVVRELVALTTKPLVCDIKGQTTESGARDENIELSTFQNRDMRESFLEFLNHGVVDGLTLGLSLEIDKELKQRHKCLGKKTGFCFLLQEHRLL